MTDPFERKHTRCGERSCSRTPSGWGYAIAYAAALKIVSGDRDAAGNPRKIFRPNAPVNRAEAAKIIYERLRVEVMEKEQ